MKRLLPQRLSARLLMSSALQLLLVGTALGLLGYAAGRYEGLMRLNLERQHHQLTALSDALSTRLAPPRLINADNSLAIAQGVLRLDDFDAMGQRFWRQMQLYPVGYINWGSRDGSFLGVERLDNGQLLLNEDSAKPLGRGRLGVYALGPRGQRGRLLKQVDNMTPFHQEAWYAETVRAGKATWSSIYAWEDKPEVLAISYNEPVRDSRGTVLGVIGVDFVLNQLSTWLQQVWQHQPGLALIVEPNGLLVASSRPDLGRLQPGSHPSRQRLDQLRIPLARAAAKAFFTKQGPHSPLLTAPLAGQGYSVEARPWGRDQGLNWLLITVISPDQSLQHSRQQTMAAALLGLLALGGALLLNRQLIRWLLAPMELLRRRAALALAQPPVPFAAELPAEAATELAGMASAFGALVARLEQTRLELAQAGERERLRDAQALELLKHKLRSSLEAAAIAHEIKLPLSQMLLACQLLGQRERSEPSLAPQTREQLQAISSSADRVVTTIEKMRSLLRNVQTSHQPLNLSHLVRSALLYLKPALSAAAVEVASEGLDSACPIQGDAAQLQIAIVNVVRNSLEALQQRPTDRRIQLRLTASAEQVVLQIDDNGPGFPAIPDLLEPLQSGRRDGSGLGLFVVQTTLSNHHGSIELGRSDLGGAAVLLRLPRQEHPPDREQHAVPSSG